MTSGRERVGDLLTGERYVVGIYRHGAVLEVWRRTKATGVEVRRVTTNDYGVAKRAAGEMVR